VAPTTVPKTNFSPDEWKKWDTGYKFPRLYLGKNVCESKWEGVERQELEAAAIELSWTLSIEL